MVRIAGIIYPSLFKLTKTIQTMLRVYPQEQFTYSNHLIHLGQTEKAVTLSSNQLIALVFDGEIWNRKALIEKFKMKSNASNESLLIQAYEHFQLDFLNEVDGDFAFCIYDKEKERLILGRDRVGKKPLYWYQDPLYFLFASELKSLMVTGIVPQTPALDGVAAYFALGYFPQDMSPIEGVNKLLPGYYLVVEKDRSVHIRPFWSLSSYFAKETQDSKAVIIEKLSHLIDKAVEKRMPQEGAIGCFISGGLGSASVADLVNKQKGGLPIKGISCGFSGQNEEDIRVAKEVCQELNIPQSTSWITTSNFLDDLVPMLWHLDEPIADPNMIAIWKLAKEGGGLKTVFSGMGSDEILASHNRYTILERYVPPLNRFLGDMKKRLKRGFIPILQLMGSGEAFKLLKHSQVNPYLEQYVAQNQLFCLNNFNSLSPLLSGLFDPDLFLQKFHNISRIPQIVSACAYLDIKTRLPDHYILEFDRFTSAFDLDWRTPYLDTELIEYAASIPEPEAEASTYLKDIFRSDLKGAIIDRPKRTRRNFLNQWVPISDLEEIFPLLMNGTLVNTGLISKKWLQKMCVCEETMENAFRFLFSVLILELWFKMYINRPLTFSAPYQSVKDLLLEI